MTTWALESLKRFWTKEDELLRWSESELAKESYLQDHLQLFHYYMNTVEIMRRSGLTGDRHFAIGGLFLRSFDNVSHSLRSAMSGNYSGCVMYIRDLVETQFLIDYLLMEPGRPEKWLKSEKRTIKIEYKPYVIRRALDDRDGFTKKKRMERYEMLSMLGAHPTPHAFEMKRDGTRTLNAGPFKQAETLKQCVEELARAVLVLSGILLEFVDGELKVKSPGTAPLKLHLQRVREKYIDPADSD